MKESSGLQTIQEIYKDPKWFFCVDPQDDVWSLTKGGPRRAVLLQHVKGSCEDIFRGRTYADNTLYVAGEKFLPLVPIIFKGQLVIAIYPETEMAYNDIFAYLDTLKCSDYFADPLKPTEVELEEYELTFGEPYMYSQKYFEEFKKTHYESLNGFERLSFHVRGLIWEVAKTVKLL